MCCPCGKPYANSSELSGRLPWAPQGFTCWYPMALSSGARYLTSSFYDMFAWLFLHDHQLTSPHSASLFVTQSVACFYVSVLLGFYLSSSHHLFHSFRQMAAFARVTPAPPPQKTDCFIHCWLLQVLQMSFSYWTETCPFMISSYWFSSYPLRKWCAFKGTVWPGEREVVSLSRGWSIKLLKEVTFLRRAWKQCHVSYSLNLGKCPEFVEKRRRKRDFFFFFF